MKKFLKPAERRAFVLVYKLKKILVCKTKIIYDFFIVKFIKERIKI